jgi:hypothetical protein
MDMRLGACRLVLRFPIHHIIKKFPGSYKLDAVRVRKFYLYRAPAGA